MTQVRIREVVGTVRMVDGESLLTPQMMERIVAAVLDAVQGQKRDEASRRRDMRIGKACCDEAGSTPGERP